MNCDEFVKLLGFYVDGQLPKQYREEFELHLKVCNVCLVEYNKLKRYLEKVSEIPPGYPAPDTSKQAILSAASLLQGEAEIAVPVMQMKNDSKHSKKKKSEKAAKPESEKNRLSVVISVLIVISVVAFVIMTAMRLLRK